MTYNFTVKLKPYARDDGGVIGVDPVAEYGYFELADGAEGGGLWFERTADGTLELVDFDGQSFLPRKVAGALRAAGYIVEDGFTDE